MIAALKKEPNGPRDNLFLAISIERPRPEVPEGYICMTASVKSAGPDEVIKLEDAADGPINAETIEAVIRDLRSYVANGRKAFANDLDRDDPSAGRTP